MFHPRYCFMLQKVDIHGYTVANNKYRSKKTSPTAPQNDNKNTVILRYHERKRKTKQYGALRVSYCLLNVASVTWSIASGRAYRWRHSARRAPEAIWWRRACTRNRKRWPLPTATAASAAAVAISADGEITSDELITRRLLISVPTSRSPAAPPHPSHPGSPLASLHRHLAPSSFRYCTPSRLNLSLMNSVASVCLENCVIPTSSARPLVK